MTNEVKETLEQAIRLLEYFRVEYDVPCGDNFDEGLERSHTNLASRYNELHKKLKTLGFEFQENSLILSSEGLDAQMQFENML